MPPSPTATPSGLMRAEVEAMGLGWICEWRTDVEVELTRKAEARVVVILRHLLATYDDVVYRVQPSAMTVVTRSAAALKSGGERVMIRPYPPPTLAAVA